MRPAFRQVLPWLWCCCLLLPAAAQVPTPPAAPMPPPATPAPGETPGAVPPSVINPTVPPKASTRSKVIPVTVTADRVVAIESQGLVQFFGNVSAVTEDATIHADEASYNDSSRLLLARGNVSIITADGNTYWGNVLEYAVATRQWRFLNASVEYPAGFLGPPFVSPVFVHGREFSGLADFTAGMHASDAEVTTCNLPMPHYLFRARRVDIYPGDKLIARDNDFYALGRRIIHVPYVVLSLRQRRTPIVPEFGRNEQEGYYVRGLYQYVLSPDQVGGVRLDETQKLGAGLGIDHFYTLAHGGGEFFGYARQGLKETVLRLEHQQDFTADTSATVRADIRRNSQFTSQPTTVTLINTNLMHRSEGLNAQFVFTDNSTRGAFSTDNITSNLVVTPVLPRGTFTGNFRYSSFASTGGSTSSPANQQLWSSLTGSYPLGFASFNIRVDHRADIGGADTAVNRFSGVQRLPEISLLFSRTPPAGSMAPGNSGGTLGMLAPFTQSLNVGWGVYNEMTGGTGLNRYQFLWESPYVNRPLGSATRLAMNSNFKQTVYGDADTTAQYVFNVNTSATTKLGAWNNVLRYTRKEVHGFPALNFDVDYPTESLYESLQFVTPAVTTYLTVGRDMRRNTWTDMTANSFVQLSPSLSITQYLAYDLNNSRWRDLNSRVSLGTGRVIFNAGTQYNLQFGRLLNVRTELAWQASARWSLEWLGGYDVRTRQYLYNQFLLKRDLHCWDAALYYDQEQHSTYLYLRLKALNMPLPQLGIGRGGQRLDTYTGVPL